MTKYRFTKQVITSEVIETEIDEEQSKDWDESQIFEELDERLAFHGRSDEVDISYEYIVEVLEPDGWNTKLKSTDKGD